MSRKKTETVPVLSLSDIAGLTTEQAADGIAERYHARTRQFVEIGKFIYHMESVAGVPKGKSIYGILKQRGVPEGSVHNGRMAASFVAAFVVTGLLTEKRADEIITHRVVHKCDRILSGKSAAKMDAAALAPLLKKGKKDAIGDELDCLDEHGVTIAARNEAEKAKREEAERLAKQQEAAASTPAPAPENPAPDAETPAPAASTDAPAAETPAPADNDAPAPVVVDGTKETPAAETPAAETPAPVTTAELLAEIGRIELQSYDLDDTGMQAVRDKLLEWAELLGTSIEGAKKPEKAAA